MIRKMFDDPEPKSKKQRKRPKYNASTKNKDKPVYKGMIFDSGDELDYYKVLESMVESGEIMVLHRQIPYTLIDGFSINGKKRLPAKLILDFEFTLKDGTTIYQDYKGNPSPKADLQRKLFESRYRVPLQWISYSKMDGGWINYDELKKRRAKRKRENVKK